MQLTTNRMNFTTSSVAQFNYARFLTKSQSPQKGITDIVTVLGIHSDGFAALDKTLSFISRRLQCKIKKIRKKRALVLYVPLTKVRFNSHKPESWFRIELNQMELHCGHISVECDFRTGEIMCNCANNVVRCYSIIYFCTGSSGKKLLTIISKWLPRPRPLPYLLHSVVGWEIARLFVEITRVSTIPFWNM